jgi:hypothetical protein
MIVQAAMMMLVLLGLSAFAVDYGLLWVSRAQAQNAADASAVAGATARAYDDLDPEPSTMSGIVVESVRRTVEANPVWFDPYATSSVVSFGCPPEIPSPQGIARCVRVDVYRDGSSASTPLPTLFGPVLRIASQGVRATATAHVAVGNATNCLKPWAIPDKWIEGSLPSNDTFERYDAAGKILMNPDRYEPPASEGPGSGYRLGPDLGSEITLSFADPDASEPLTAGFLLPLVLPGANTYEANIAGCNGRLIARGREIATGTPGMEVATTAGFADLIASDPGASWNAATRNVQGGCAPECAAISPRLVALALFDVDKYQYRRVTGDWDCSGGTRCVSIVNIVGFFLDRVEAGGNAVGYLARYPGLVSPDDPFLSWESSFLPAITLVR